MNSNTEIIKHEWKNNVCINCGLKKKMNHHHKSGYYRNFYSEDGKNYTDKRPNCIIENKTKEMKLKDKTFAVLAEKRNGIVHNWICKNVLDIHWGWIGEYYIIRNNTIGSVTKTKPTNIPVYTEAQLEALIKAEENPQIIIPKLYL